jgi:hypothetical protein
MRATVSRNQNRCAPMSFFNQLTEYKYKQTGRGERVCVFTWMKCLVVSP